MITTEDLKPIEGTIVNPNTEHVYKILNGLNKTGGNCPCVPSYLYDSKKYKCPCIMYKDTKQCCCGLYITKDLGE